MDYVENVTKDVFFLEQMLRQQQMKRYIQECQILASGEDIPYKLNSLNEDLKESAQGLWQKIKTIFNRIWLKFLERIDHFCKNDADYLKQYQNIILNKKAPDATYTMPDYTKVTQRLYEDGLTADFQTYIPLSFVKDLADKVREGAANENLDDQRHKWEIAIQNAFKGKNMPDIKEDTDFATLCKEYYGGGEEEDISASAINMADAYDLCFTAKTTIDELNKIKVGFDKWMKEVETQYNNEYRALANEINKYKESQKKETEARAAGNHEDAKTHEAQKNAAQDAMNKMADKDKELASNLANKQQPQQQSQQQQQQQVTNNSYDLYSVVYNKVLSEASVKMGSSSSSSGNKSGVVQGTGNSVGSENKATSKTNDAIKSTGSQIRKDSESQMKDAKDQATVSAHNAVIDNAEKDENALTADSINKFTNLVTTYTTICTQTISTILGAKCNAVEKMRKDYMFVIRTHVKYWLGRPDNTDDNVRPIKSGSVGI